jgi:protein TonB
VDCALYGIPAPRLPTQHRHAMPFAGAAACHVVAGALLIAGLAMTPAARPAEAPPTPRSATPVQVWLPPTILLRAGSRLGTGGGGGGNRQSGPIRNAHGIGHDAATLRTTRRPPVPSPDVVEDHLPAVVLDARSLASGTFEQVGLPSGGVESGSSTGPGSGGGVGTGHGTGIGSGTGPGIGPGSGGGFGGGAYRPGGLVTPPSALVQVRPHYTVDALHLRIQGSVWLEVIVDAHGLVGDVRVQRSLDPGGLDEEAIIAVRQWRFVPGRRAGVPVDVLVTVVMDFSIR